MSSDETKYDQKQARLTERAYMSPEIASQRMTTLAALALNSGEHVLDVGVGPGLLSYDMAQQVGENGRVVGIDNAEAMVEIARERCRDLSSVDIRAGNAQDLEFSDGSFDAVVCTQVLLYVSDVSKALGEFHRVLKPGGRLMIVETDWRGLVLNSSFSEVTEKMIDSWDAAVASPRLPPVLTPMLAQAGFSSVNVAAVPVSGRSLLEGNYAHSMLNSFRRCALKQDMVTESEANAWQQDLHKKNEHGAFFFCINRFLFSAFRG